MSNRTDNFNRANSTSTINPPSDGGSNWTAVVGTWGIATNKGYDAGADAGGVVVLDSTTSDVDVQATVSGHGGGSEDYGLVGRLADSSNYLLVREASGAYDLFKQVSGSFTAIFTGQGTAADGDVLKLSMSGSTIKVFVNASQIGGTQTITAGQTNTKHGFRDNSAAGARYDDFSITDTGGGGTAYSLSGSAGSFALTGEALTPSAGRPLSASAGAFALTGKSAAFAVGRLLSAAAGAFTLTGKAITPSAGHSLAAGAGSFMLTGEATTLARGKGLSGTPGSFALTGESLGAAMGRLLSGGVGSFTIGGQAAALARGGIVVLPTVFVGSATYPYTLAVGSQTYPYTLIVGAPTYPYTLELGPQNAAG